MEVSREEDVANQNFQKEMKNPLERHCNPLRPLDPS